MERDIGRLTVCRSVVQVISQNVVDRMRANFQCCQHTGLEKMNE